MSKNSRANKAIAAKVNAAVKTTKAKRQPVQCGCLSHVAYRVTAKDIPEADPASFQEFDVHESCGGETMREFLPGHDAKLKSHLINCHVAGRELSYINGGTLIHESAMNMAQRRGWEKFLTAAGDKADRKFKAKLARDSARMEAQVKREQEKAAAKAAKPAPAKVEKPATKTQAKAAAAKVEQEAMTATKGAHPVRVKIGRQVVDANVDAEGVNEITISYKRRQGGAYIDTTTIVKRSQIVND